jgi:hypothetical protein
MKKLIPVAILLSGALAFAQTNNFYITDESLSSHQKPGSFSPEQIDAAKHAKESRPAKDDPEGNWGEISEGFQLSIRLLGNAFTNGEPIKAFVILRNVSDTNLQFPISYSGDPPIKIAVMRGQQALNRLDEGPGTNFADTVRRLQMGSYGLATCLPGTQRKFTLDLSKIFALTTNGNYTANAKLSIPKLDQRAEAQVASSEAFFKVVTAKP